jgi:osmoprotectant transport system substrate-binding protein
MISRRTMMATTGTAIVLAANPFAAAAQAPRVTVGGKAFTEQLIVAEMTNQLLTTRGFSVDKRTGMATAIVREAQVSGQIDLYWEYTGTSLVTFNKVTEPLTAEQTLVRVRELDAAVGLVWLTPSRANNTYAIAVRRDDPKTRAITTISQLAAAYGSGTALSIAMTVEFARRDDGLVGMQKTYGFSVPREAQRAMDAGLVYNALRDSQVDVGSVFATDGRVNAFNFRLLSDDRAFFPTYALTPVIRRQVLERLPALRAPLEALAAKLDDATMQRLNASVDVEKKTVEDVARTFLREQGL